MLPEAITIAPLLLPVPLGSYPPTNQKSLAAITPPTPRGLVVSLRLVLKCPVAVKLPLFSNVNCGLTLGVSLPAVIKVNSNLASSLLVVTSVNVHSIRPDCLLTPGAVSISNSKLVPKPAAGVPVLSTLIRRPFCETLVLFEVCSSLINSPVSVNDIVVLSMSAILI